MCGRRNRIKSTDLHLHNEKRQEMETKRSQIGNVYLKGLKMLAFNAIILHYRISSALIRDHTWPI